MRDIARQPVALLIFIVATVGACGGPGDAQHRAAFAGQCEAQLRARPEVPAGLDVPGACACGVEAAFANRAGVAAYAATPEGQQAFAQALAQCLRQRVPAPVRPAVKSAPAAPPVATQANLGEPDPPDAAEDDAEGEAEPPE